MIEDSLEREFSKYGNVEMIRLMRYQKNAIKPHECVLIPESRTCTTCPFLTSSRSQGQGCR